MILTPRSRILAAAVALLVAISAMWASEASAGGNLLGNPGFEDPPFAGAEEGGAGAAWTPFGANFRVQCPGTSPGDPCPDPVGSAAGAHEGIVALKNFGEAGAFQDFPTSEGFVVRQYLGAQPR